MGVSFRLEAGQPPVRAILTVIRRLSSGSGQNYLYK
jgi:hypothetical protein